MSESEDSIESYWDVIRPHLIERARQRRAALIKSTLELPKMFSEYKIIKDWSKCENYKDLDGLDGYRIKK